MARMNRNDKMKNLVEMLDNGSAPDYNGGMTNNGG
jgi:hypothetical protein